MEVINIKNSLKDLNFVMDMIYEEWGKFFRSTKEEKIEKINKSISNNEDFPQIYILKENDEIVGSFTIKDKDLENCDLSPWLACVVVRKDLRGKGYGNEMLRQILKVMERDYTEMYLTTQHVGYYEKIGYKFQKFVPHNGETDRLYKWEKYK